MPLNTFATRAVTLVLALGLTGCESSFTAQLWKTDRFHHVVKPVPGTPVEVFYSPQRKDYLLAYEADERFSPHRRQFYLGENVDRLEGRRKPQYASASGTGLQPVPVNKGTNALPAAVIADALIIHTEQGLIGPFPLPGYNDGGETALQVVLTPFAVAGDLALICLIIGVASGIAYAAGSCVNCSR